MMSPEYIREVNLERAAAAAEEGLLPFVYAEPEEVGVATNQGLFPFPHLGDHRPEGWELVDTHFVDASGFGAEDEPALTVDQFIAKIREVIENSDDTVGWAVIEAGQFQVYVGEFHKPRD